MGTTGNRVVTGTAPRADGRALVALPDRPAWVLGWEDADGRPVWYVALESGGALIVDGDGVIVPVVSPPSGEPPELLIDGDGVEVSGAYRDHSLFDDPLDDARVVEAGTRAVALVDPTDRYPHGVLSDAIEAAAVQITDRCTGDRTRIEVTAPSVIEGTSPLIADLDGDGADEILVTLSNADVGAWLAVYRFDGTLLAQSDPIGRGQRWRNQLAVAPVGPDGEVEVVDVRTPHIGGIVEYLRLRGDRLEVVAEAAPYTTHVIGTRNLDMGLVVDADGDGQLEVVVPSQDRLTLAVLARADGGVEVTDTLDAGSSIVTNVTAVVTGTGTFIAAGTEGGDLVVWGSTL